MEAIYKPADFGSSEPLRMKEYFERCSCLYQAEDVVSPDGPNDAQIDEAIFKKLDITDADAKLKLKETFSVNMFKQELAAAENARPADEGERSSPTLSLTETEMSRMKSRLGGSVLNAIETEYERLRRIESSVQRTKVKRPKASSTASVFDVVPARDFLITVRVYVPFRSVQEAGVSSNLVSRRTANKLRLSHEILALGSTSLAEFRDKILCTRDHGPWLEYDRLEEAGIDGTCEDVSCQGSDSRLKFPSGFLFFSDTFYNDMRDPRAVDYSQPIREWATKNNVGPLSTADMNETNFEDLTVRFGYPYVYQHMGYCEHIVVFHDARLVNNADVLDRASYPYYTAVQRYYCRMCALCSVRNAKWIVTKCKRLPHRLTYMCKTCFHLYNFEKGTKIDDFNAYPYFDRTNFC